jgi:hypothetical protein
VTSYPPSRPRRPGRDGGFNVRRTRISVADPKLEIGGPGHGSSGTFAFRDISRVRINTVPLK